MMWGCFYASTKGACIEISGDPLSGRKKVTGEAYLTLLREYLPDTMRPGLIFMQDNSPIHTAHIVRDWFEEMGYNVMDWPPYSPDMNPIEHIWIALKKKIHEIY